MLTAENFHKPVYFLIDSTVCTCLFLPFLWQLDIFVDMLLEPVKKQLHTYVVFSTADPKGEAEINPYQQELDLW